MPEVIVYAVAGRTPEQKKGLMKDITDAVVKNFGVKIEAVTVQIVESPKTARPRAAFRSPSDRPLCRRQSRSNWCRIRQRGRHARSDAEAARLKELRSGEQADRRPPHRHRRRSRTSVAEARSSTSIPEVTSLDRHSTRRKERRCDRPSATSGGASTRHRRSALLHALARSPRADKRTLVQPATASPPRSPHIARHVAFRRLDAPPSATRHAPTRSRKFAPAILRPADELATLRAVSGEISVDRRARESRSQMAELARRNHHAHDHRLRLDQCRSRLPRRRAAPRPGETVRGSDYALIPGGKGANQALAARRAGAQGAPGRRDRQRRHGRIALVELEPAGVDLVRRRPLPAPTGLAIITVDDKGENTIVVSPGANARATAASHPARRLRPRRHAPPPDGGAVRRESRRGERRAAAGARVILSVAPFRPLSADDLAAFDMIIVNEHEAADLARHLGVAARRRRRDGRPRSPAASAAPSSPRSVPTARSPRPGRR